MSPNAIVAQVPCLLASPSLGEACTPSPQRCKLSAALATPPELLLQGQLQRRWALQPAVHLALGDTGRAWGYRETAAPPGHATNGPTQPLYPTQHALEHPPDLSPHTQPSPAVAHAPPIPSSPSTTTPSLPYPPRYSPLCPQWHALPGQWLWPCDSPCQRPRRQVARWLLCGAQASHVVPCWRGW